MEITFSYAGQKDFKVLSELEKDHNIRSTILKNKINNKEIILTKVDSKIIGRLRFGLFWDEIPFMNMLKIDEKYRKKGIGKKLVQFWEQEMIKRKFKMLMTSSQSDEDAQCFYRKLGYVDAGSLVIDKDPLEIIFIKNFDKLPTHPTNSPTNPQSI